MNPIEIIVRTTQEIAADDKNAKAYKERASVLYQMQQFEEAQKDLDMLIDTLHAEDAEVLQMRGSIRMQAGNKNGALEDFKHAIDICPELLKLFEGEFKREGAGSCH